MKLYPGLLYLLLLVVVWIIVVRWVVYAWPR